MKLDCVISFVLGGVGIYFALGAWLGWMAPLAFITDEFSVQKITNLTMSSLVIVNVTVGYFIWVNWWYNAITGNYLLMKFNSFWLLSLFQHLLWIFIGLYFKNDYKWMFWWVSANVVVSVTLLLLKTKFRHITRGG